MYDKLDPKITRNMYPEIRSLYYAAIDPWVTKVRIEGDLGTGKTTVANLLTIQAAHEIATQDLEWTDAFGGLLVLAYISASMEFASNQVFWCKRTMERHPDLFPSTPKRRFEIRAYSGRTTSRIGDHLVHAVVDESQALEASHKVIEAVQSKVLRGSAVQRCSRVVVIRAFEERDDWLGRVSGIFQGRNPKTGETTIKAYLRLPPAKHDALWAVNE